MRIQGNNLDFKLKGNISSSLRNNSNRQNGNLERKNTINFNNNYYEESERYTPKIFILLILLEIVLFSLDLFLGVFFFTILIFINFGMIWLYSLISIIKNDFKKENQKLIWIILIIFLPFTAYLYPDFRKVQVINKF